MDNSPTPEDFFKAAILSSYGKDNREESYWFPLQLELNGTPFVGKKWLNAPSPNDMSFEQVGSYFFLYHKDMLISMSNIRNLKIISVVNTDKEMIELGQTINENVLVTSLNIIDGELFVNDVLKIERSNNLVFITEEGTEIRKGDKWYSVHTEGDNAGVIVATDNIDQYRPDYPGIKRYSNIDNAKKESIRIYLKNRGLSSGSDYSEKMLDFVIKNLNFKLNTVDSNNFGKEE